MPGNIKPQYYYPVGSKVKALHKIYAERMLKPMNRDNTHVLCVEAILELSTDIREVQKAIDGLKDLLEVGKEQGGKEDV